MKPSIGTVINPAERISNNQDLLSQILLRLPTKSLLKFKCVSKSWLSFISDPHFCVSHTRYHHRHNNGFQTPTALLLQGIYAMSPPDFYVVPLEGDAKVPHFDYLNAPKIKILQSCNGLFICGSLADNEVFSHASCMFSRYFLCNPTTKKFKILSLPVAPRKGFQFAVNLAFDPLKSPHYKIICVRELVNHQRHSIFELDIYSSEMDSWSISRISFYVIGTIAFHDPVYCDGRIHWYSCCGDKSLYFDVENECLETMPMPIITRKDVPEDIRYFVEDVREEVRYFGECQGNLYLAVTYDWPISLEVDFFALESDYSGWYLKNQLMLFELKDIYPEMSTVFVECAIGFSGMCFIQSEKEAEPKVVVWADGKVFCFDFNEGDDTSSGEWKMLYDPGPGVKIGTDNISYYDYDNNKCERFRAYKYFENLSSI